MAQLLQFPKDERTEANNRCRDLALELHTQGNLLQHIDPAQAMLLQGKALGLLLACEIIVGGDDA